MPDTDSGDDERQPLPLGRPLRQNDDSKQHGHQRVDEITQACLDHLPVEQCPDIHQPIGGEKQAAEAKPENLFARQLTYRSELTCHQEHGGQ